MHGLMTNDSMIVAAAIELGIDRVATNDADFAAVTAITVHQPTDVP